MDKHKRIRESIDVNTDETEGVSLENNERRDRTLTIDRDAQIQVMVNQSGVEEDTIDLGRVFHTMKLKWRVFAWVLALCIVVGACAPLLLYQFAHEPLKVSSVVTLKYGIPDPGVDLNSLEPGAEIPTIPVEDLTAPDGTELDLNQITSSYVLQNALEGLTLSEELGIANLRSNIAVERILTEESRRQQEVASSMIEEKNSQAYATVQGLQLKYENTFVVSLTNGFGDEDSKKKIELPEDELRLVLDRVLASYNDYLLTTYQPLKLPDDEISAIDTQDIDILESLDQLRAAVQNLYDYCDNKSETTKAYRSWKTGRSLTDWMETLETVRDVNVEYLYSYVYTNSIVKDKKTMITNYQYQLRDAQTQLDVVNENIETVRQILEQYKNDEIYVSMQESDAAKSTKTTTDYYNRLILQQADNYEQARKLKITISDLEDKIASLTANIVRTLDEKEALAAANVELASAVSTTHAVFEAISDHMEEYMAQPSYTTFAEHSAALGKSQNFLTASMKNIIIGVVGGAVIACGLWFLSGLAPEFRHKKEEDEDAPGDRADMEGKEAAE